MTKYKVGDKVWLKDKKDFAEIIGNKRMTDNGEKYPVYSKKYDLLYYYECNISKTSDTMLKELGFEKVYDSDFTADYKKTTNDFTTRIDINKRTKTYTLRNYTNNKIFGVNVDKPLHEALTQFMVEMEAKNEKN